MSGKKSGSSRLLFPWSVKRDPLPTDEDIALKLFELGYNSDDLTIPLDDSMERILKKLFKKIRPEKGEGKWFMVLGGNAARLSELHSLVPQCYALMFQRSVHSISWSKFARFFEGDESVLPHGKDALKRPALVVFEGLNEYSSKDLWHKTDVIEFFAAWNKPFVTVLFTASYRGGAWSDLRTKRLFDKLALDLAPTVENMIRNRVELIDVGHFLKPTKYPKLKVAK